MTAKDLRDIIVTNEYRLDLEELSSYLASIKQERPIIYSLARFLWKRERREQRGLVYQLEVKQCDMVVDDTHLEFKYSFDCDMARLDDELSRYRDKPLSTMWNDAQSRKFSKSWHVMPQIYGDMCIKKKRKPLPDIFVWIICSRDLSKVGPEARKRVCWSKEQCKWSETHSYSDWAYAKIADSFLEKLRVEKQTETPFSVISEAIATNGDFPSTYHFRICEFSNRVVH
jgi:hypothetical protein